MNHTYRVVYNETTNTYTAVAEIATAKGKSSKSKKVIAAAAVMTALQLIPLTAQAAVAMDAMNGQYPYNTGTATATAGNNIAIGAYSNSTGANSTVIGVSSVASGADSIVIGRGATGSTVNSVIIGQGATSNNFHNAVAIGAKAETATSDWTQNGSVHAQYRNPYNVVTNTRVVGGVAPREGYTGDTAISNGYQVAMSSAVAVGYNAKAGNSGVAIGSDATVTRTNNAGGAARALGIAIGANALSAGGGVVIGASASTSGVNAIAVGRQATAANASAQAYGASSAAVGQGALAMGHSATSLGTRSIAIGMSTKDEQYDYDGRVIAAGNNSIAFGSHARAGKLTQEGSITNLDAQGNPTNESKYILDEQDSSVERATAIGYYANASAVDAIAFGSNATVSGNQSIAIGTGNKVSGNSAGAFGDPSFIAGDNSYSLGNNHVIANNSNNAISIGGQNKLGGDAPRTASGEVDATKDIDDIKNAAAGASYSMVIGFNNTVNADNVMVLGNNISVEANKELGGSVILGQNASTAGSHEVANVTNATVNGITYGDFAGKVKDAGRFVSVGAVGDERKIINVAAGNISATSTEAINGSQLYLVANGLKDAMPTVTAAGENTTITSTTHANGSVTYTVDAKDTDTQVTVVAGKGVAVNSDDKNTNGTTIYNVSAKVDGSTVTINDAGEITAKTGDITTNTNGTVKLGDTVNGNSLVNASTVVDAINNASFAVNSKNTEDQVVANNGNTTVKAGSNITYQAGKNLVVNQTGDVIAFGLTESINVTNVTATDTIRIGDTGPSISTTGIDAAGKTITNVAPGTNGTDAVNLDQLNASKSVVEAGDNTTVTSVTNKDGSITYTVNAKAGEGADGDTQVTVVAGKGVAVNSDDKNTNGTTIYNVSAKVDGSTVTINDAGEITAKTGDITTNTNGTVKLGDTVNGNSLVNASTVVDAINNASFAVNSKNTEDQVVANNGNTTVKAGSNITYQAGKNLVVNQTGDVIAFGLTESINVTNVTATDTIRIGDTGPSISTTGIDAAGKTITNVAPGTNGTDAVNLDQLNASKSVVEAGDNTTVTSVTNKDGSITYTVNAKAGEGADGDTQVTVVAGKGVAVNSDDKNTNGTTIYNVSAKVDGSTVTINDAGEITAKTGDITTTTDGTVKLGDNVNGDSLVNASTVVDAINNASWNLSENGVNKDAVQPGDTVNFVDGTYTTANISSDGNVSNVTFNVNGTKLVSDNSPVVYTDKDGNKVYSDGKGGFVYANGTTVNNGDVIASMNNGDNSTTTPMSLTNVANGTISNTSTDAINGSQLYALGDTTANIIGGNSTFNTTTGGIDGFTLNTTYANGTTYGSPSTTIGDAITNLNKYVNEGWKVGDSTGTEVANVTPGEQVNFVNSSTLVSKVTPNATTGAADVTFEIVSGQIDANPNGTVVNNGTGLVTNTDVINAINNSGWNLTTNNNASNETLINPGETVSINAGSNMEVTQDGNNVTVATKENVTFTNVHANNSVSIGNTTTGDTVNMTVTNGTNGSPALTLNNSTGGPVQITNVAAGDVSANSTDAINGSQLYQIYQVVGGNTQNVSTTNVTLDNGENVGVAVSNNYTMMTYNVKDQTEYLTNDVIEAIGRMNEEGIKFFHTNDENVNKSSIQHHNSVDSSAAGAYSTAIGARAKANGEHSLAIGSSIGINVTTLPNGTKVYSSTQDTVAEADSSIAFGHGVNVTATATQAIGIGYANTVSGEQAIALGQNATVTGNQSISIGYGNKVTGNNSGAFGDPTVVTGDSAYSIGNNNTLATDSTYALGSNITNTTDNSVFLGDASGVFEQSSSTLNNATGAHEALNTTASAYTYQNVNSTQVKGVDDVVGVVSVGNATATRQIQGVAAGVISSDSTDAINGSQLYNSLQEFTAKSSLTISTNGGNPTSVAGGNINFNNGNGTTVVHDGNNITINTPMTYVDDAGNATHNTTNDVTFIGTPKTDANGDTIVDQNGKPVYNNVTIHNVAPGVLDNDAVNVSQLKQVANNLNNKIDNVADDADAGTASAMATAGLPQVFEAGKSMVAVAGSTYRGKQGYAVGFSAITDGGNWIIKGTASGNSKGHFGATVGAGYQW
ncbi:ESPR-type extended signal peptide-containing protein [Wielerella bovis]|uniref:ESPR-type extended signal peptide-containing protein n=1 Tax=Wielerella bovis TaxID=2917790 RepID=UPI0020199923|nr:ESPR-type extended signal peptide-containing protein [Wielerella bovis]MCG7656108.1 YadA-like family protein [Wielerella bovis]MCG7658333.1 YadA-like family protein [Wielerella bovis]